jgi:hypothetical protein
MAKIEHAAQYAEYRYCALRATGWANNLQSTNVLVVGRDFATAGLEFHFHRLVIKAIDIELQRAMGHETSGLTLALHLISLRDGADSV